jgi:predicted unusual protein kinase regulating ubiquinone biosynthesis (AarF/ABC1/UbiB family)
MSDRERELGEVVRRRLLGIEGELPTSSLGRFGRAAVSAIRCGRLTRRHRRRGGEEGAEPDAPSPKEIEALVEMAASIGQLKGIAMKVGQILGYFGLDLPEEVRTALAALQTSSPPMPFDRVRAIVEAELGSRAPELLARMDPAPVAAASIGQVHRAKLPGGLAVAVKVRYPDVAAAIASDFRPASFGTRLAKILYPGARIESFVREARERFLLECDYLHEARSQERFARLYASHDTILVPEVHPAYCTASVLTTTFIDGMGFEAFLASSPPQPLRDRLGEALFTFYIGTIFEHGLYNCDPHPGNYLFLPAGRIALLDYGCTREFDRAFVQKLARLTLAVHTDAREDLHRALVELEMVREGKRYDHENARALLRSFYGPMLRDEILAVQPDEARSLSSLYEGKRALLKLSLPGEFLFLLRIRFGLMSILSRLGACANWYRLERRFLEVAGR